MLLPEYRKRYLKKLYESKFYNEKISEKLLKTYFFNQIIHFCKHKEDESHGAVYEVNLTKPT